MTPDFGCVFIIVFTSGLIRLRVARRLQSRLSSAETGQNDYNKAGMKFRHLMLPFLLTWTTGVIAQDRRPSEPRPPMTIKLETDLIPIDVTALDQNGNYVRDLREDEIQILVDGV